MCEVFIRIASSNFGTSLESKEVKLPHLKKPKGKGTGHQRKDESPKNNGNKFPNTYREDKRKIRGPPQMAKKEFEKGEEVLLLSPNRRPHCGGRYIGPYVITQRIDKRTYIIVTHEGREKAQVCHANKFNFPKQLYQQVILDCFDNIPFGLPGQI